MFCIYSKVLLDGICTVALQIGAQDSCLLHGRLMKEQNAASFDMNDMEAHKCQQIRNTGRSMAMSLRAEVRQICKAF